MLERSVLDRTYGRILQRELRLMLLHPNSRCGGSSTGTVFSLAVGLSLFVETQIAAAPPNC
jgi:hypothetical protein